MAKTKQPWEQQPGESDKAYRAFCVYLMLGPDRSIDRAFHHSRGTTEPQHKRASRVWNEYSTQYDWVKRVSLYDQHVMQQAVQKDAEVTKAILTEARTASLKCVEKIAQQVDKESDIRAVSSALNALTQCIGRLAPKGDVTLGEALDKILQEVRAGNVEVLKAILATVETPLQRSRPSEGTETH